MRAEFKIEFAAINGGLMLWIKSGAQAWEKRELGATEEFVRKISPERKETFDEKTGSFLRDLYTLFLL